MLLFAICAVITGCGHLGYDGQGRDAGVGMSTPQVDGGPASIDAGIDDRADGGDAAAVTRIDSGAALEPDAGPSTEADAGSSVEPDASAVDSGVVSGCAVRCARDEFCATPEGMCSAVGACSPRPESCPDVYDPVQGCDGVDYSSGCFAARAGTSVAVGSGV